MGNSAYFKIIIWHLFAGESYQVVKITVDDCLPSVGAPEGGGDDPVGLPEGGVDDPRRLVLLPPQLSLVVAGNLQVGIS
jgi:hypothetical protein